MFLQSLGAGEGAGIEAGAGAEAAAASRSVARALRGPRSNSCSVWKRCWSVAWPQEVAGAGSNRGQLVAKPQAHSKGPETGRRQISGRLRGDRGRAIAGAGKSVHGCGAVAGAGKTVDGCEVAEAER